VRCRVRSIRSNAGVEHDPNESETTCPADGRVPDGRALCEWLQVEERTTLRWRRDSTGPPFLRLGSRQIRYRRSDVDRWLAERTFQHRAAEIAAA